MVTQGTKLSQIDTTTTAPVSADFLVGVTSTGFDRRYTPAQVGKVVTGDVNVFWYGAVGNGATDDTAAFAAAIAAAGEGGHVVAPGGYTYLLSGLTIDNLVTLTIYGDVVVPPGSGANYGVGIIINSGENRGRNTISIYGELRGQESIVRPNTNNHLCIGISARFTHGNTLNINSALYLSRAVEVRSDINPDPNGRAGSTFINLINCDFCHTCVYSKGGTGVINHTQGTTIRGDFWMHYAYGIFKEDTVGNAAFWDVEIGMDAFANADFVASIVDPVGLSYYRLVYDDGVFTGAGMPPTGRSWLLLERNGTEYNCGTQFYRTGGYQVIALNGDTGTGANIVGIVGKSGDPVLYLYSQTGGGYQFVLGNAVIAVVSTAGIGYNAGAGVGGAVTQLVSRTTGVQLDKATGAITLFSAAGSTTEASFTVTNNTVVATDTIILSVKSATNKYIVAVTAVGTGTFEITFRTFSGTAVDSPVINFSVIKGSAN